MSEPAYEPALDKKAERLRRSYHHGDLRKAVLEAARSILEECPSRPLTMREVARRAGVSHAAPYRHFANHEAVLAELSIEGFRKLKSSITEAAAGTSEKSQRIANIGSAYMRFVMQRPAMARLMFGSQLPNRGEFQLLGEAADGIYKEIGQLLADPDLALAVWASAHGFAMLVLENVIDLGQGAAGAKAFAPGRGSPAAESLLDDVVRPPFFTLRFPVGL
jgi:AcrR family transcriptional regulator